jgi:predicted outer membrane repeat protein
LENITITGNSATNYGGGIYFGSNSSPSFHSEHRCNIYLNNITNSRGYGADIFAYDCDTIDVIVDTFTVLNPSDYYASPIDNFNFDILHSIQDTLINSDLYVSVDGDNLNSGTSPDEPLKTIGYALSIIYADSSNHNTIHLLPGIYSSDTNEEVFPIEWSNYLSLEGSIESESILDGDSLSGVMRFRYVTDAVISNITIRNGSADFRGGGVYCTHSSPILENVTITGNSAEYYGGGIYCYSSNLSLTNVTITVNSAVYGGGIYCSHSSPSLQNVTISGNSSSSGGGIYCNWDSNPTLINCILWNNSPEEIYFYEDADPNSITISYSDIQGGEAGIVTNNNGTVNWLEGNIDADPLFIGTGEDPYSLLEDSPCIDAGIPDTTGLNLPPWDIIGNLRIWDGDGDEVAIIDMGAYEYGAPPYVDVDDNIIIQSPEVFLHQNYPNPFNPETMISFSIPEESKIELTVYNIKGQKVRSLANNVFIKGNHSVVWNGDDDKGKSVSSGIYFYKLRTKEDSKIRKMILLR